MTVRILIGDVRDRLKELPDESVHTVVTSPPYYGLRDYGVDGQIGLEPSPDAYIAELVTVFREVRRVMRQDATLWLNLGDSYAGSWGAQGRQGADGQMADRSVIHARQIAAAAKKQSRTGSVTHPGGIKAKDLMMIPARVALALQADGWWLRSDIIWHKPNPMPESVQGSHFSRHMVTIEDYERLSGLPYVDERAGDDWAGDMPDLSQIEVPCSKAPLSAERQGKSDGSRARGTGGCAREASAFRGVRQGPEQQQEISKDGEGQSDRTEASGKLSRADSERGRRTDGAGMDSYSRTPQASLLLLPQEINEANAGSCGAAEQGWQKLAGERGARLPLVQFQETEQDDPDLLVGCPGCDKCVKYHGYIFHMSAGRPTSAHEHVFLLAKAERYYFNAEAVKEPSVTDDMRRPYGLEGAWQMDGRPSDQRHGGELRVSAKRERGRPNGAATFEKFGHNSSCGTPTDGLRNIRNVWTIATQPYSEAHFATFPPDLIEPCIKAGCPPLGTVLDPFGGAGTTGLVADRLQRSAILIELNPAYAAMAEKRLAGDAGIFASLEIA